MNATATISRTGYTSQSKTMSLDDIYATCQFTNVATVLWKVSFKFVTTEGNITATPQNSVSVEAGKSLIYSYKMSGGDDNPGDPDPGDKVIQANAGPDQTVKMGTVVTLDGTKSINTLNSNNIQYQWSIITKPEGSTAELSDTSNAKPTFTADVVGSYEIGLVVNDGTQYSTPDTISVFVCRDFTNLSFGVTDAEFSKQLDRIVIVSASPNQLHIYDPSTNTDTSVALPLAPTSVSVGPDGTHAAVGYNAYVSYVNLETAKIDKTYSVTADVLDVVLAGNGYIYAFPKYDQWESIRCIEIATGLEKNTNDWAIYAGTKAKLHPSGKYMYGADNGLSPSDIEKYDIQNGSAQVLYDSPYHGDYPMGGDLWFSEDGLRIFVKSGYVFKSSEDQTQDMRYNGRLSGVNYIAGVDHSQEINQVAALVNDGQKVNLYDYEFLSYQSSITLPSFVVNNQNYAAYGKYIFFNNDGSHFYVITQADGAAGMLHDFAVVSY